MQHPAVSMALVASLLLLSVLSTVCAQNYDYYTEDYLFVDPTDYVDPYGKNYGGSGSGSGSGFGDSTLADHEKGDDYYDYEYPQYELPLHDPTTVDICNVGYPNGIE